MIIKFKTKIQKQAQAAEYWIDTQTEQILYGGAKGGGKSYLGASLIFGDALIYPGTHYFIARQELTDLRKFTIPTINEVFTNWGLKLEDYAKLDGQYNVFHLTNGSKVYLLACKEQPSDPLFERFGSMTITRGWIEEGGEVAELAKSNLWLSIGRWKNDEYGLKKKLLITANPKKGWMKRDFIDQELDDTKKYIQAFATDNVYLSKDYIETLKTESDTITRQRLFEGRWDYDEAQDSLISYDALTDSFTNVVAPGDKYLIVDVARFGKDSTTLNFWNGLTLYRIEQFHKQDTFNTIQRIKEYAAIEQIPYSNIMVDEDGIGGAVVDGLFGVKGFIANSTALPTRNAVATKLQFKENTKVNFKNLKTQCAYKLADMLNHHQISFTVTQYREKLIEELDALLRCKNPDDETKLQIKSKEDVKQVLGRSPDLGDPVIYRMWFELKKDSSAENIFTSVEATALQEQKFKSNRASILANSNK